MGAKFEVWRLADQVAYDAEMQTRPMGRRSGYIPPANEELERVRTLRFAADQLFDAAMVELSLEVGTAIDTAGGVCASSLGRCL